MSGRTWLAIKAHEAELVARDIMNVDILEAAGARVRDRLQKFLALRDKQDVIVNVLGRYVTVTSSNSCGRRKTGRRSGGDAAHLH